MGRIVELVEYKRLVTPGYSEGETEKLWRELVDAGFDCFDFEGVFVERPWKAENTVESTASEPSRGLGLSS